MLSLLLFVLGSLQGGPSGRRALVGDWESEEPGPLLSVGASLRIPIQVPQVQNVGARRMTQAHPGPTGT